MKDKRRKFSAYMILNVERSTSDENSLETFFADAIEASFDYTNTDKAFISMRVHDMYTNPHI